MKKIKSEKELRILKPLFWDYKWNSVKKNLNSPFVISRILELANPEQFKIFASFVGEEEIINFLNEKGKKIPFKEIFKFPENLL